MVTSVANAFIINLLQKTYDVLRDLSYLLSMSGTTFLFLTQSDTELLLEMLAGCGIVVSQIRQKHL